MKAGSVYALHAALLAIALVPVFGFGILPLGDMPNHLARAFIMNALPADPDLQKYYSIEWRFFSFQSTDLLLPLLTKAFGLEAGAHLFVAAAFTLLLAGTACLHRAFFGRVSPWPAAAALFLISFPFALGQISFLFTTGLSLLLFAAWIASLERHGLAKVLLFAAASLGLLLCHFFAFAAYALLVSAHAAARWWREPNRRRRWRDLAEAAAPFVLPAVVYLLFFNTSIHGRSFYGDIFAKAISVLAATITYGRWPDIVVTVAVIAGVWLLHRRGLLSFATGMRFPVLVLVVAAIAMPRMLQGVLGADLRIPCLLAFLLVAASDVAFRSRREIRLFSAALVVLLLFRVATLFDQWRAFDADYREFRSAAASIERGSRVLVIPFDPFQAAPAPRLPYWYLASLAVIDRSVFLPHLYTIATPLRFTEGRAADLVGPALAARPTGWHPETAAFAGANAATIQEVDTVIRRMAPWDTVTNPIDWSDWPEQYDVLVDLDFGERMNPVPALLTEVGRGAVFTIYRIHPPQ
jgi:hypothetical protein